MDNENKNIEDLNQENIEDNFESIETETKTPDEELINTDIDEFLESEPEDNSLKNKEDFNFELSLNNELLKSVKPNKRILQGVVVSAKPNKTIVVKIVRQVAHPLYKKYYKRSKKIMAHDEHNECNAGDTVKVIESRPISKLKRWSLLEIIERAK